MDGVTRATGCAGGSGCGGVWCTSNGVAWETPGRRWNLLDMLRLGVWPLVNYTHGLTLLSEQLGTQRRERNPTTGLAGGEFTAEDRRSFRLIVNSLAPWLHALGLTASVDRQCSQCGWRRPR